MIRAFFLLAAGLVPAAICTASAALAPDYYIEARRSAAHHVQVEITGVEAPSGQLGSCPVTGKIVNVFRGPMLPGDPIAFDVSCHVSGEIPDSAVLWTEYETLNSASHLEVFLSADTPPRVVLDQVAIIAMPRATPYCDDQSLSCESIETSKPQDESCGLAGRTLDWLGLGDCKARD